MAATMHDVARLAGVSIKTVSNVVNGFPKVRPETRERVEDAIAKLNYEVNLTARNLRRGKTGLICLALPELKLPYFAELADSIIVEAGKAGLSVLIEQTNSDREREIDVLHGARRFMTDGLIFSPLELSSDDVHLFKIDFPMVLLGERVFGSAKDLVTMNNVGAAAAATEHLLDRGCRRIALLGAHPGESVGSAALRERGYRQALADRGISIEQELIRAARLWHRDTGAEAMDRLIDSGIAFDGVFAMNDAMAIGALHRLLAHRIDVPGEVALIGFDDIEDAAYTTPALSTVSPGRAQIARVAIELLQLRIRELGSDARSQTPPKEIEADFSIVSRASSARPVVSAVAAALETQAAR